MSRLRTATITGGTLVVVAAAAVATVGLGGGDADPASPASGAAPATAPVTRTTLTETQQVDGTLGYGTPVRVTRHGGGTVTWLPTPGATITRGGSVYQVDDVPVPLFYGDHPFYRSLKTGDTGQDVKELEQNLHALGYTGMTVDTNYTAATASAVRSWQKDHSLPETGSFDGTSVVLAPAAVRVASLNVQLGDPADGQILSYSGTTRLVQVPLDVSLQSVATPGAGATVTLPGGRSVHGTVATVGSVATAGRQQDDPATIPVTITIADQSGLGTLDQAPVTVTLVSASVRDVLTVPVAALVAVADGGTAVQVVSGSTIRDVSVRLGMFADGRVEISGDGITEGTRVVIPS